MQDITYSDGRVVKNAVVVVWEDNHNEKSGFFRAFWSDSPNGSVGSPVIGYCSAGGSHKTIKAVAAEVRRLYPQETIYHNGKVVKI